MKLISNFQELKKKTSVIWTKQGLNIKLSNKLDKCSSYITTDIYKHNTNINDYKLKKENGFLCKSKFCYVCESIKNQKYQYGLEKNLIECVKNKNYIEFLTLTVKNIELDNLGKEIDKLAKAWDKLLKVLKKTWNLSGYFKSLEITYSKDKNGVIWCHPHFHILLVYPNQDFTNPKFNDYKNMWKNYIGGSVYIESFKTDNIKKSIQELTKYLTKSDDYKVFSGQEFNTLERHLKGRRFYSKGGSLNFSLIEVKNELLEQLDLDYQDLEDNYFWVGSFSHRFFGATKGHYHLMTEKFSEHLTPQEILLLKMKLIEQNEYSITDFEIDFIEQQKKTIDINITSINPPPE